ncbi:hypothetical protein JX265_004666 [Neoarthrinium moseri]|uniref:MARVEL domain-containing protein n=1 Tax=Neoarthrinium moseri TaxID=1658444 RepID=A0A9P9WQ95_9PEZI|nr:uncharacterized protein JN550_003834 [Neoarthrinium moseri]KAI1840948.1 hypothetical protein JX266_012884 [Neoarthrinium moseri]KAI1872960.1 hypothetical protein JN550_003834 [Neoarthrinium moseri]KAI1874458.1 hypothetical protein JX265_004666 [Neoarthrinium moseri]
MGFITAKKLIAKAGKGAATKQIGLYENIARWAARGIQLVFALVVVGLYAHRVDEDRRAGRAQSAAWAYATVVAGMSCITCVVYAIPFAPVHRLFAWDLTLFILWIAVFGTFANIFLKREEDEYEGTSVRVMKVGVWIDLVNCLLWLATGAYGSFRTFLGRKAKGLENKLDGTFDAWESKAKNKVAEKVGFPPAAHLQV